MPLHETFAEAIWATDRDVPMGVLPAANFAVYRNNVYAGLIKTLEARFPVVQRLVGDDFFAQSARIFVEKHPPQSPVLLDYGAAFPDFLTGFGPAQALPYLAPVAELEWQHHVALHGPDATPLDTAALGKLPMSDMDRLSFVLHPTCHILAARYPILSIWQTNTFDAVTRAITVDTPGETVLLVRPYEAVQLIPLEAGADVFAEQLQRRATLSHAAAQALATDARFDLAGTLAQLFRAQAFVDFHLIPHYGT